MGMGMGSPFGDEVMTIIMGIDPSDPGMHGPLKEPCPTDDAIGLITKIKDMCEEWLCSAGKCEGMAEEQAPEESGGEEDGAR